MGLSGNMGGGGGASLEELETIATDLSSLGDDVSDLDTELSTHAADLDIHSSGRELAYDEVLVERATNTTALVLCSVTFNVVTRPVHVLAIVDNVTNSVNGASTALYLATGANTNVISGTYNWMTSSTASAAWPWKITTGLRIAPTGSSVSYTRRLVMQGSSATASSSKANTAGLGAIRLMAVEM